MKLISIFLLLFCFQTTFCDVEVANGVISKFGQFPHMVSIIYTAGGWQHYCGGGLINKNTVLLAAHCIDDSGRHKDPTKIVIQAGTLDVYSRENGRIVKAVSADVHPKWIPDKVDGKFINDYDIAVLHLEEDILEDGEGIRYMDLDLEGLAIVGNDAVISGWGYTKLHGRDYHLRDAVVPIQPSNICAGEPHNLDVTPALMICAGDEQGTDSCSGDSGSPLVRVKNEESLKTAKRWSVIGIVSFGSGKCGEVVKAIGVYSRVSAFKDWLLEHTYLPDPPDESMGVLPHLSEVELTFSNSTNFGKEEGIVESDKHLKKGEERDGSNNDILYLLLIPLLVFVCMCGWVVFDFTVYICIPTACFCTFLGCLFCGICTCFDVFLKYRSGFRPIQDELEDEMEGSGFHDMEYELNDPEITRGEISGDVGGDVTINN